MSLHLVPFPDKYDEAKEKGAKITQSYLHCITMGPSGVGKTWLKNRITGRQNSTLIPSTDCVAPVEVCIPHKEMNVFHENSWEVLTPEKELDSIIYKFYENTQSEQGSLSSESTAAPKTEKKQNSKKERASEESQEYDSSTQSNEQDTRFSESFTEKINNLVGRIKNPVNLEGQKVIYFTDTGGQASFHEVFPALLTVPRSMYLLVFNLKDIDVKDEEESCKKLVLVESALRHIYSSCSGKEEPIAYLVGTHKDKVLNDITDRIKIAKKVIQQLVDGKPYKDLLKGSSDDGPYIYAVDNTQHANKTKGSKDQQEGDDGTQTPAGSKDRQEGDDSTQTPAGSRDRQEGDDSTQTPAGSRDRQEGDDSTQTPAGSRDRQEGDDSTQTPAGKRIYKELHELLKETEENLASETQEIPLHWWLFHLSIRHNFDQSELEDKKWVYQYHELEKEAQKFDINTNPEPSGSEHSGSKPSGSEHGGSEPSGSEHGGSEPSGLEHGGSEFDKMVKLFCDLTFWISYDLDSPKSAGQSTKRDIFTDLEELKDFISKLTAVKPTDQLFTDHEPDTTDQLSTELKILKDSHRISPETFSKMGDMMDKVKQWTGSGRWIVTDPATLYKYISGLVNIQERPKETLSFHEQEFKKTGRFKKGIFSEMSLAGYHLIPPAVQQWFLDLLVHLNIAAKCDIFTEKEKRPPRQSEESSETVYIVPAAFPFNSAVTVPDLTTVNTINVTLKEGNFIPSGLFSKLVCDLVTQRNRHRQKCTCEGGCKNCKYGYDYLEFSRSSEPDVYLGSKAVSKFRDYSDKLAAHVYLTETSNAIHVDVAVSTTQPEDRLIQSVHGLCSKWLGLVKKSLLSDVSKSSKDHEFIWTTNCQFCSNYKAKQHLAIIDFEESLLKCIEDPRICGSISELDPAMNIWIEKPNDSNVKVSLKFPWPNIYFL